MVLFYFLFWPVVFHRESLFLKAFLGLAAICNAGVWIWWRGESFHVLCFSSSCPILVRSYDLEALCLLFCKWRRRRYDETNKLIIIVTFLSQLMKYYLLHNCRWYIWYFIINADQTHRFIIFVLKDASLEKRKLDAAKSKSKKRIFTTWFVCIIHWISIWIFAHKELNWPSPHFYFYFAFLVGWG